MRVGVAKVGAFPFYKEKTRERRGETLNPKLPKGKKKSAFTKMPSGIDGRERERRLRRDAKRERAFHPKKTFAAVSFVLSNVF